MLAKASPRKPYVSIEVKSSKDLSLDVVKRSQSIGRSSFYDQVRHETIRNLFRLAAMPWPLSVICRSFKPPSLTRTSREVEPASTEFSMSSFSACTGATMISPAAILLTTSGSRACHMMLGNMHEAENEWPILTLILLGAVTTIRSSSAFLFVPLGSESTSIGSAIFT